jgi:molecular chaperone DnaK
MHDQIVNHFRNRRKEEAFILLEEATDLRDRYDQGGIDLGSIHLKK